MAQCINDVELEVVLLAEHMVRNKDAPWLVVGIHDVLNHFNGQPVIHAAHQLPLGDGEVFVSVAFLRFDWQ